MQKCPGPKKGRRAVRQPFLSYQIKGGGTESNIREGGLPFAVTRSDQVLPTYGAGRVERNKERKADIEGEGNNVAVFRFGNVAARVKTDCPPESGHESDCPQRPIWQCLGIVAVAHQRPGTIPKHFRCGPIEKAAVRRS